ncbi:hypothetical protein BVRB_022950, partial [Beta vulgaris subsp. vulgaris]
MQKQALQGLEQMQACVEKVLIAPGSQQTIWGCPPLNLNASSDSLNLFPYPLSPNG